MSFPPCRTTTSKEGVGDGEPLGIEGTYGVEGGLEGAKEELDAELEESKSPSLSVASRSSRRLRKVRGCGSCRIS